MEIIKTKKGCLTILSGKTDMGKSTISVYNAAQQIREGEKVTFISYEYCQSMIYTKLVLHFGLKWQELFNVDVISGSYMPMKAIDEILKVKGENIDILYLDYLDILRNTTYPNDKEIDTKVMHNNRIIVSQLAALAHKYNIAIVLLAQQDSTFEIDQTINFLNDLTSTVLPEDEVIKMFIIKDAVYSSRIKSGEMSNVILVDGYDLKHFSSINIQEAYKKE